jgi:hypothetical protein
MQAIRIYSEKSDLTQRRLNLFGVLRIILEMLRSEVGWEFSEKIDNSELYFDSFSNI